MKSIRTTPYHPQSNGQTERFNKTLGVALTVQVPEDKEKWSDFLQPATYAYNTSVNETTGFTPFELVYGYNPDIGICARIGYNPGVINDTDLNNKRAIAKANIEKSQQRNQLYANRKRISCNLKPGDLVLIFSKPLKMQKGGKLEDRWIGPYRIDKQISEQNFVVLPLVGPYSNQKVVNTINIKKYYDRNDFKLKNTISDTDSDPKTSLLPKPVEDTNLKSKSTQRKK